MKSPWLYFTRRLKLIMLPLIASILTAVYVAMDKFYLSIIYPNNFSFGFISLWIGSLFTFIFLVFMNISSKRNKIGAFLDPNFRGIFLPKGYILKWLIIAGLAAGVGAITYFYIVGVSSTSTIIPFSRITIIYLVLTESIGEKESPSMIEWQSIIMILIGVFLMATTDLNFDLLTMFLVLGPYNIGNTIYTIAQRKAKRAVYQDKRSDALNLRFWSLLFNAFFLSILTIPFINSDVINGILNINPFTFTFIAADMMISTIAFIAYIRALGIGKMSIVNAIMSFSIVLGIPITIIGNWFYPSAFGESSFEPLFWFFKIAGVFLIVVGIITIGLSQVKGYLLIYLNGSADKVIHNLLNVKGIE
ncbi:MAG: hypothetical protein ACTSYQ_00305, partial [Candidatus Odinarchaeia archaeon]